MMQLMLLCVFFSAKDIAAALGLENRLQNEGYRCWVKDALCLQILKEGLETFADMKSKELHQKMLQELKKMGNPSVAKMCCSMAEINYDSGEIHCKTCKSDKKNVTLHELRGICQPIHVDDENCTICCNNANCTNCKEYMTVLNDYKAGNFMFSKESLQNADISKLHKEPWQLAKMFMNGGQDTGTVHPSDTDVSGILNFIKHCRICQESLAQGYLPDVSYIFKKG